MDEYELTSDLFAGEGEPVTKADIEAMVADWDYEGWSFEVTQQGHELRVYCMRDGSAANTPNAHTNWIMYTRDAGYIIVAESIS